MSDKEMGTTRTDMPIQTCRKLNSRSGLLRGKYDGGELEYVTPDFAIALKRETIQLKARAETLAQQLARKEVERTVEINTLMEDMRVAKAQLAAELANRISISQDKAKVEYELAMEQEQLADKTRECEELRKARDMWYATGNEIDTARVRTEQQLTFTRQQLEAAKECIDGIDNTCHLLLQGSANERLSFIANEIVKWRTTGTVDDEGGVHHN